MNGQQNYIPNYSYMGFQSPTYGANYAQRPFMQMPNPQMQQQIPQQQIQQQPVQTNNSIPQQPQQAMPFGFETQIQAVRLANEEEAKGFIVYPNHIAVFIDDEKGKIYLKTANQAGASSIRYYNEIKNNEERKEPVSNMDFGNFVKKEQLNDFVTIEKHNELFGNYKYLDEQLRKLQTEVNTKLSTPIEQKPTRPQPQIMKQ